MEPIEVANWACSSEGGGYSDIELHPGTYRLGAADLEVVTGPLDSDFYIDRPDVTAAKVSRDPGSPIKRHWPTGRRDVFIESQDVPASETLEPVEPGGFVVGEGGEYRIAWGGKGSIALVKVA